MQPRRVDRPVQPNETRADQLAGLHDREPILAIVPPQSPPAGRSRDAPSVPARSRRYALWTKGAGRPRALASPLGAGPVAARTGNHAEPASANRARKRGAPAIGR